MPEISGTDITILTREAKGAPLTSNEMDANLLALQTAVNFSVPIGFQMGWDVSAGTVTFDVKDIEPQEVNLFNLIGGANLNLGSTESTVRVLNGLIIDKPPGDTPPFIINSGDAEIVSVGADGSVSVAGKMMAGEFILTIQDNVPSTVLGGIYTDGDDLFICVNS
tara:strand:+ start:8589 stop:9083 length:495 start_codon:yes stop_codon:yes gene_type:complete